MSILVTGGAGYIGSHLLCSCDWYRQEATGSRGLSVPRLGAACKLLVCRWIHRQTEEVPVDIYMHRSNTQSGTGRAHAAIC